MKRLIIASSLLFMMACNKETIEIESNYILPEELKDCKIFKLSDDGMSDPIKVIYCPDKNCITTQQRVSRQSNKIRTPNNINSALCK